MPATDHPDSKGIQAQVQLLISGSTLERQRARHALETMGGGAGEALATLLDHERKEVRWEATKALIRVAAPTAAARLAKLLDDEDAGNRWVAGEALVALGQPGVEAVLVLLATGGTSPALRAGAHHVLHDLPGGALKSALAELKAAIEGPAADEETPLAASQALAALKS